MTARLASRISLAFFLALAPPALALRPQTYRAGLEEAEVVRAIAEEWGLSFTATPPTLAQLLAAFLPGPLAVELAAGLEQGEALGRQL